eukprot:365986-Chlamydomonas_euryale.AAC.3
MSNASAGPPMLQLASTAVSTVTTEQSQHADVKARPCSHEHEQRSHQRCAGKSQLAKRSQLAGVEARLWLYEQRLDLDVDDVNGEVLAVVDDLANHALVFQPYLECERTILEDRPVFQRRLLHDGPVALRAHQLSRRHGHHLLVRVLQTRAERRR